MCFVKLPQFYVFGEMVGITSENTYDVCMGCGELFKVDLYELARQDNGDDIRNALVSPMCPYCAAQRVNERRARG